MSLFSNTFAASPTSQLIFQPFRCSIYITAHAPTLPSLHLRHSSFSNPSVASPTSQLIFQPFRRFTYITAHYPTLPLFHLHHSSLSNPSVTSPTSHLIFKPFLLIHLCHLASRPCIIPLLEQTGLARAHLVQV